MEQFIREHGGSAKPNGKATKLPAPIRVSTALTRVKPKKDKTVDA
jgi:hypothetical protein